MGLKIIHTGKFKGKIKMFSTIYLLCWKFVVVCQKLQPPAPTLYFFNPWRRCTTLLQANSSITWRRGLKK